MSLSDSLTIGGILISVLFGIWGIYLTLRRAKYPATLTFVREQSVELLHDFAMKIPNLAVLYKNIPIDKSVVLFSGYLVNDGSLDITKEMIDHPLTCILPGNCSWLEFKVTTAAAELKIESCLVEKCKVILSFNLFRRDESFSFQALALLDEEHTKKNVSDFAADIRWSHRIAGLGKVKTIQMPRGGSKNNKGQWLMKGVMATIAVFYMIFGLIILAGVGPFAPRPSIAYMTETGGMKAFIRLTPNRDGTTTVADMDAGKETQVDLVKFAADRTFMPLQIKNTDTNFWVNNVGGLGVLFMAIILLYFGFSTDFKRYRIKKLVAASARET